MNDQELEQAVRNFESSQRVVDSWAEKFARLLIGRLRRVRAAGVLTLLKRELRDWNIHTSTWKN